MEHLMNEFNGTAEMCIEFILSVNNLIEWLDIIVIS